MTDTAKPEKQSNVTESTGKLCSACDEKRLKAAYSKKQWLEPAASRRCTECVAASKPSKAAQPHSAAAATATAASAASTSKPASASSSSSTAATTTTTSTPSPATASSQPPQPKLRPNKTVPHAHVQPKRHPKRPALLDADGDWFLAAAEAALTEVFNRFDADGDGHWTIRETQSFATATNGKPFTTEELYEVTNHFFKDNKLPRQGFLQFYHLQTSSHPAETWKDLQKLGYGWDVKSGAIVPPPHVVQQQQQQQQKQPLLADVDATAASAAAGAAAS